MEEEEIDLKDLFLIVWKKRTMIVVTTLLFMVGGLVFSMLMPASAGEYETFTSLRVNIIDEKENEGDFDAQLNAVAITDRLINTYGEIARSRTVANEVIDTLKLKDANDKRLSYKNFTENIEVELVPGTEIIKIKVKGSDAKEVAAIANEVSSSFLKNVQKHIKTENIKSIQVIDEAEVPEEGAIGGGKLLKIIIAAVLGMMLSVFAAFLLNYLDLSVRKTEELERVLGLQTLVEIDKADKSSLESYTKLRTNLEHGALGEGENAIVITSSVSGEGSTLVASSLATSFSKLGKKVLLIDANMKNPQINSALGLEDISVNLNQILSENKDYKDSVLATSIAGLDVIASSEEKINSSELLDSQAMKSLIEKAKEDYDYVILDTPNISDSADALILSAMTDASIFVSELNKANRDDVIKAKEELMKVKANIVGIVARV